jgi:hypothetical protein
VGTIVFQRQMSAVGRKRLEESELCAILAAVFSGGLVNFNFLVGKILFAVCRRRYLLDLSGGQSQPAIREYQQLNCLATARREL